MDATLVPNAIAAGGTVAAACGLPVEDATVLHDSNRIAVRFRPCEVLARVTPRDRQDGAAFEVEMAQRLASTSAPAARLDPRVAPRVYEEGDFAVTLWAYHAPVPPLTVMPPEYAGALSQLHAGLRHAEVSGIAVPHFLDRVDDAQRLIDDPANNPAITGDDRALLGATLRTARRAIVDRQAPEQLLHGEPHPGNCSGRALGCCSSTSRPAAAAPSSSTWPMRLRKGRGHRPTSPRTTPVPMGRSSGTAGSSCWR